MEQNERRTFDTPALIRLARVSIMMRANTEPVRAKRQHLLDWYFTGINRDKEIKFILRLLKRRKDGIDGLLSLLWVDDPRVRLQAAQSLHDFAPEACHAALERLAAYPLPNKEHIEARMALGRYGYLDHEDPETPVY